MKIEVNKTWIYDSNEMLEELGEVGLDIEELKAVAEEWSDEDWADFVNVSTD